MSAINIDQILADHETNEARRAEQMPDDFVALRALQNVYLRFKEMGWGDAIFCPKDGTVFEAIEAGSTGIHKCIYMGEWPKGRFMVMDGGDLFPSRPILFRLLARSKPSEAQIMAAANEVERIRDFIAVGPVQKAALVDFVSVLSGSAKTGGAG